MLLIEADGKALFAEAGIRVPVGRLVREPALPADLGPGPFIVKAQLPAGGRGKAGLVRCCATQGDVAAALPALLGATHKGHPVAACLIEEPAAGTEQYLALMTDAASYGVRLIYHPQGGVDVEAAGTLAGTLCAPDPAATDAAIAAAIPDPMVAETARALGRLLLERELTLAEINPLFVGPEGCVAGDAKVVIDLNALPRQPRLAALIAARPDAYADAARKLASGFDYVEIDPGGSIGLLTTGAGLSMMLIDELVARGARPLNFCDIRTSMLRGSPARIVAALRWMTARPSLRVVLVNIFAGITDLGEFAALLADAIAQSPGLRVPVVARLVGRGAEAARQVLAERAPDVAVEDDLPAALARVAAAVAA
jgi:succinyl-CoA synthetase beta subunit